jgi:hypothetical protein
MHEGDTFGKPRQDRSQVRLIRVESFLRWATIGDVG